MRKVTFAATQMACFENVSVNLEKAEAHVRQAAVQGAQVVLLQELFETPYFCKDKDKAYFALARPTEDNPVIARFADLAKELGVVIPLSFFEKAGTQYFNSLVMIDADGSLGEVYRKSHIPEGPGYEEKFYFSKGDTGFKVWQTAYGIFGAAVCWDQWFPEAARSMALLGAEVLLYPTAIGSEPHDATLDSSGAWQRVMQGHAAANVMPVIASNRVGYERGVSCDVTFYGSSFITDQTGAKMAEMDRVEEGLITATFDLDQMADFRANWGLFRDRRPDLYGGLSELT